MSKEHIIPEQEKGSSSDTEAHASFKSATEAADFFRIAKKRLLDVSNWDKICGKASAKFQLTDNTGSAVAREPKVGDHFQINIPAPGNDTGEGYDWVQIEAIDDKGDQESDYEYTAIKVRPATNPQNQKSDTAHFFKEDATSTFLVERKGNTVRAEVHGRNELPNTKTEGVLDTIRNALVALGAMAGISTPQWKSLVNGIVEVK
ncbi:MAG: hypothetical protein K0S09_173 [Sphingobacteriaceae bacterium]|jgi:hypothetical protein|nr:hypothetical protein [Sphingobacteriaceae bacterium]